MTATAGIALSGSGSEPTALAPLHGASQMRGVEDIDPDWQGRLPQHRSPIRSSGLLSVAGALILALAITIVVLASGNETAKHRSTPFAAERGTAAPLPKSVPPKVEELVYDDALSRDEARRRNASVAFVANGVYPASPFILQGNVEARERAVGCLTAAVLYEAGDDVVGQRAVAQVVLNRLRHPAFPKTVCGVVFQGAERTTGCQFTFTCDGSLARVPSEAVLNRARAVALSALHGSVDPSVGLATHYHTDWVVPYWSSRLDKIAQVGTHLFFRWSGWWGSAKAFSGKYSAAEPAEPKIASYFPAHQPADPQNMPKDEAATAIALAGVGDGGTSSSGSLSDRLHLAPTATNADIFLVTLPLELNADRYLGVAERACGSRRRCVFMAWTDRSQTPAGLPASTAMLESMVFHYLRDPALSSPRVRWNCTRFASGDARDCLSHQRG